MFDTVIDTALSVASQAGGLVLENSTAAAATLTVFGGVVGAGVYLWGEKGSEGTVDESRDPITGAELDKPVSEEEDGTVDVGTIDAGTDDVQKRVSFVVI